MGMHALENGASMLDFSSPQPDYRPPIYRNPKGYFPEDTASRIRPWLFGNWWKSARRGLPLQLIGLGVRFGTSPQIEDAAQSDGSNKKDDDISFRGTFLRLRIDPSTSPYCSIVVKAFANFYFRKPCG
jgi:hypothetical protein